MNRNVVIIVSVVVAIALGIGVFWMISAGTQPISQSDATDLPSSSETNNGTGGTEPPANPNETSPVGETSSVTIENSSYSPDILTVKKGTTVTWTNQDNMGHNVVSDSDSPAGGPPATNDLLDKGETYSFTFDTVGTFTYHCTPHPFMKGTIEVVE